MNLFARRLQTVYVATVQARVRNAFTTITCMYG